MIKSAEKNFVKATILSALAYYLSSIPSLFKVKNFWKIPLLFFKKPILFRLDNNLSFYLEEIMDIWVIKEIIFDKHYEKIKPLKNNDLVIDVGAAFGDFSIYAAQKAKKIYAYDPNTHRINLMQQNLKLNNTRNVKVYNKPVESLDKVFEENRIGKCHFLKVDCEGYEYHIFQKASDKTLRKIDYIAMEIHLFDQKMETGFQNLKQKLEKNGFKIREFYNPVHDYLRLFFAWK